VSAVNDDHPFAGTPQMHFVGDKIILEVKVVTVRRVKLLRKFLPHFWRA
jgi:hypothetical protein